MPPTPSPLSAFRFLVSLLFLLTMSSHLRSAENEVHPKQSPASTFADDLKFLQAHKETILLSDKSGAAQAAVIPAYQGRVMTSTANGASGLSFGWINRELIGSGETKKHINAVGGEDRIWLGPEGGQFGLFFEKGAPFDLEHWFTPPAIDTEPFEVVVREQDHVEFQRKFSVTNATGTKFDVAVSRQVRLLSPDAVWKQLGIAPVENVTMVAIETVNRLTNAGDKPWKKETGLLSIWILGMFNPSPATTIVVPITPGPESVLGKPVNSDYFGPVPPARLVIRENAIYFKGDGEYRSKIGILPSRATPIFGSYDAENKVLTLISYNPSSSNAGYVNSQWKIQDAPFGGDVINSYNDGPPEPGAKPLGPFYEMETSSPAAALAKGQTLEHIHRTYHIQGSEKDLDSIARATLHVGINEIENALPSNPH
jgi:hypothetical protein